MKRKLIISAVALAATAFAQAQNDYLAGASPADRKAILALIEKADRKNRLDSDPGVVTARETLGYIFYTGADGIKQDCHEASAWFNAAAIPFNKTTNTSSVMGKMFLARIYAEGCPIHQGRSPHTAEQLLTTAETT